MSDPTTAWTAHGQCLTPYLPADQALWPAWLGCVHWALGDPDILAEFRADTGLTWTPGRTPIDRMVDEATGIEQAFLAAFVAWVNSNIWGED